MSDWKIKREYFMKHCTYLCFLFFSVNAIAQTSYDSSFHFYYYDQKLSMFEQMPTPKKAVVWLGDSITDGGEWSELFPGLHTLNRGISADNTFGILHRLNEVCSRKPKKIFLLIGINDIARGIPDDVIISNYQKIVGLMRNLTSGTKIYLQSIMPTNNAFTDFKNHQNKQEHIATVNAAIQKLADGKKVFYVDLQSVFSDVEGKLDKRYTNDGLHLLGSGYTAWKAYLKEKNYF